VSAAEQTRYTPCRPKEEPFSVPRGRIYYANAGKSFVLQAGPQFKLLATDELGDGRRPPPRYVVVCHNRSLAFPGASEGSMIRDFPFSVNLKTIQVHGAG